MNNTEDKYIVNMVFQQPFSSEEMGSQIQLLTKSAALEYSSYKDAKKAYTELIKKGFMEFETPFGVASCLLVFLELRTVRDEVEENGK